MPSCHEKDILNNVIFAFKMSLLSEKHLMTVVINMHKPYLIFKTDVMSWLCRCHVISFLFTQNLLLHQSSIQTYNFFLQTILWK